MKIDEEGVVSLTATCSAVIQKSLAAKMKDPGNFTIPCTIGKYEFKKDLCDSSASINLMPLSVVQRLSLGELTPTTITLQMADRSMAQPEGVLDSCHGRVIRNQQKFVSYVPPTAVVKLLQYSGLGSNTGMGFHPTNDSH